MSREQAYAWMMYTMKLPRRSAHIALFSKMDCDKFIEHLKLARRRGLFKKKKATK